MITYPIRNIQSSVLKFRSITLNELLFCISIISIFLPVKIYPALFLLSSLFFIKDNHRFAISNWLIFLSVYISYTLFVFVTRTNINSFITSNIVKLVINFIFLITSINWILKRDNTNLLYWLNRSLQFVIILVFLQLFVYHLFSGFRFIFNVESSAEASLLYKESLFFWGVFDKNMLGGKIALLGYLYIMIDVTTKNKISLLNIIFVFLISYLSLSRTPIGVILIGVSFILFYKSKFYQKGILIAIFIAIIPIILDKLIRINNISELNDGMGIRLVYWGTFFTNFNHISWMGNGFLAGEDFLTRYSSYYNGEPNLHNTFLNTYLDVGYIGVLSYIGFLIFIARKIISISGNYLLCLALFLPLVANMMILYTGYDNDIIVYLIITVLLCVHKKIDVKDVKWSIN